MPNIIAWIGNGSNEANANIVQYHDPLLPNARIETVRLDMIYRIHRFRPNIHNNEQDSQMKMISRHAKRSWCITELMPNARRIRCNPEQSKLKMI